MASNAEHGHNADTGGTPDPEGVVSGALLHLARRNAGLTREQAAEAFGVDVGTVKAWETGRRPLTHTSFQRIRDVTTTLADHGADSGLLKRLAIAMDVDLAIGELLRGGPRHPLAAAVHTREWHDLLGWGLGNGVPALAAGVLPIPAPRLAPVDRARIFDNLRDAADQANNDRPSSVLLRRQSTFILSWDQSPAGRDWLARAQANELRRAETSANWTPAWVAGRSLAVARACQGDPEPLRRFIRVQMATDLQEAANLNYWAHWAGESRGIARTDEFMAADLGAWAGKDLLTQLVAGLDVTTPYVDLTVHSVWALLRRRPALLDTRIAGEVERRLSALVADPQLLSSQATREAHDLIYAANMRRSQ